MPPRSEPGASRAERGAQSNARSLGFGAPPGRPSCAALGGEAPKAAVMLINPAMPNPRLLIAHPLAAGAEIALTPDQARHVGLVLRLDAGDGLRVFNATDGEWRARVVEKTKRGMRVVIQAKLREARAVPDLELLFAPVKRHATDLIVEKATELGAARIRPVITQRTIADTVRTDRLATIAREAAEQTERFEAPEILEPLALFKALEGWDAQRLLLFADESGDEAGAAWEGEAPRAAPLLEVLRAFAPLPQGQEPGGGVNLNAASQAASERGKLALLIGPEGGFAPQERRALRALGFVRPVSLGPRILRAETAVIAALTLVQAQWGDWRGV